VLFIGLVSTTEKAYAQLQINELSASNKSIVADEEGEFPDWIELYNAGDTIIDLSGYGISDEGDDLFKYTLPETELSPGEYYLMFASDKDISGYTSYWETVIRNGDATRYIIPNYSTPDYWINKTFDDRLWEDGIFGIGYGDNDDATTVPAGTGAVFSRTTFMIEDLNAVKRLLLHIDFDDGFIAYINGVEIARENITGEAPLPYDAFASFYTEPKLIRGEELEGYFIDNFKDFLVEGENVLAIQMHNSSTNSSDLTLIPFLSIGTETLNSESRGVAGEIQLEEFQVVYPHLNFKLSAGGETVYLTTPDSVVADSVSYPELLVDESYGRLSNTGDWRIFSEPSPLNENAEYGYDERLPAPELSLVSGTYNEPFYLSLADTTYADHIYFTVDGSEPLSTGLKYGVNARYISKTFTLRFRTIQEGKLPSPVVTHTYIIGEGHDLPIVSISTAPGNLWDDGYGIYTDGTNGVSGNCTDTPVNWNQDWERPANIELIETDGSSGFNTGAGIKIFGGCSRGNPQKSFSVFFRSNYGANELEYKLFEAKDIDKFQALVLRNAGNDMTSQGSSHFRDGLMSSLVSDIDIDLQAFRPAVLYLNGEYWGIYNIREKVNEHFIESNSNANSENIDLLEGDGWVIHGTNEKYRELIQYLESNDLSDPLVYAEVENMVDIENYIDYMVAQIYYANTDWPGNNIKFWRERSETGKFRWILYDTDFGFHLNYGGHTDHNTLEFALEPNGPNWPNPSWSTFILRKMVTSDIFVQKFVNRMADLLNTNFDPYNVAKFIDSLSSKIADEIPNQINRWGASEETWEGDLVTLKYFARYRPQYVENHFRNRFGLDELTELTVNVSNVEAGQIKVNRLKPDTYPWSGKYFGNMPVEVTAIPQKGYQFKQWTGASNSTESSIQILPGSSVKAVFEVASGAGSEIVINEIMYNGADDNDPGDWVELYNPGASSVNIEGWVLKDEDDEHEFIFESGTTIAANSYLVVAQDKAQFESVVSSVTPIGDMGFGLAGGSDQVRLFDQSGALIDSLQYDDEDPWPSGPDGTGYTLELVNAEADNADPVNWATSIDLGGSPGAVNGSIVSVDDEDKQIPDSFHLYQNYPNPFNPSTQISFDLPQSSFTRLTVYDMLGRKVSSLVNEKLVAGSYSYRWEASNYSSGFYIYRLEASGKVRTGKMLLIK